MNVGSDLPHLPQEQTAERARPIPSAPRPKATLGRRARTTITILVDCLAVLLAMAIATALVALVRPGMAALIEHADVLPAAMLVVAGYAALGLYDYPGHGPCELLRQRTLGTLIATGAAWVLIAPWEGAIAAAVWSLLAGGAALILGHTFAGLLPGALGGADKAGIPAAIIGTSDAARDVARCLVDNPDIGIRPVGFVTLPDQPAGVMNLSLPILCRLEHAGLLAAGPEVAVVAAPLRSRSAIEADMGAIAFPHIARLESAAAVQALRVAARAELTDRSLRLAAPRDATSWSPERLLKRALDIVLTAPFALLAAPIVLAAVLAVRIADPGKAIFIQKRIGLRGRVISVYKIRTMYQDAEQRLQKCLDADPSLAQEWQRHFKLEKDPRILPRIGHFLRRSSIDELPQLWNVLRGDMSLVGPRPFPAYHLASFDKDFQARRSTVIPGLTGLWQVTARSDGDLDMQKAQDLLYIDNWSIWLDLKILLDTPLAVVRGKGAR